MSKVNVIDLSFVIDQTLLMELKILYYTNQI